MKPKNFPLRKLIRQGLAQDFRPTAEQINRARSIRTKKNRSNRG